MLRIANTSKVSVLLAGLLLALSVLFSGGSAQAAAKPNIDLQAPLGGEVFAPDQEFLIKVAPQGKVLNMAFDLVVRDAAGTELGTVSLTGQSNVKPFKLKLHLIERTIPINVLFPSSHVLLRVTATTKLGDEIFESGEFIVGSPGLLPNSVDTTHIIDGQVKTDDIGDGEVRTADILDGGIATVDIADNAITSAKLLSDPTNDALRAITTDHIKDSQVTNAKIANGAVDANKLASDAVTTVKILDSAVTTAKIADGNVTLAKLPTTTAGRIIIGQNAAPPAYIAMNGDATIDSSGLLDLANNAVETSEINDLAVTTAKLGDLAVTTAKLQDSAVTTVKIGNDQVTTAKIADNAVNTNKIADGSILAADLEPSFDSSLNRDTEVKVTSTIANVTNTGDPSFTTLISTLTPTRSGAFLIGVNDEFTNSANTNIQGVLKDFDTALNTALTAQNLFSQVNVPSGDSVISANSPTTQLTLTSPVGSGLTVTGNNTSKTITLDVAAKAFDGDDLADSLAGDGLFYSGSGPRVLNVGAASGGAITVNANDIGVTADGIDGTHLATNITADDITQTFTFADTNSPLMLFSFTGLTGASNVPVYRITRGSGPATNIFTVDSDGDITTPGFYTGANGVNVSGGFLTTGPVLTPNFSVNSANGNTTVGGTLTVTGGLSASSLASDGDFVLDIDKNNDGGSANFTVKNNNSETVFNVLVTDTTSVVGSLGTTAMPGRVSLSDGSSNTGLLQTTALAANRTYTFPDKDGTVAMLSDLGVPIAAPTVTSSILRSNGTTWVETTNTSADGSGNMTLGNGTTPLPGTLKLHDNFNGDNNAGTLQVASTLTGNRTYTFPDANGTVALTSGGSLTLGEGTTPVQGKVVLHDNSNADTNTGTIQSAASYTGNRTYTLPDASGTFLLASGGALTLGTDTAAGGGSLILEDDTNGNGFQGTLEVTDPLTGDRTYTLPNATGTVALTSDITATNLTGTVPVSKGGTGVDGTTLTDGQLLIGNNAGDTFTVANLTSTNLTITNGAGSIAINAPAALTLGTDTAAGGGSLILEDDTNGNGFQGTLEVTDPLTADRTYTLPDADGTVALTSDITATNLTGVVPVNKGGTGLNITASAIADLDLVVGDNGTDAFIRKTLQGTADQVVVTNNAGTVVLSTPQSINTTSSPTFAGLTVGKTVLSSVSITIANTSQSMASNSLLNLGNEGTDPGNFTVTLTGTTVGQLIVVKNFDAADNAIIQVGAGATTVTVGPGASALILVVGTDDLDQL